MCVCVGIMVWILVAKPKTHSPNRELYYKWQRTKTINIVVGLLELPLPLLHRIDVTSPRHSMLNAKWCCKIHICQTCLWTHAQRLSPALSVYCFSKQKHAIATHEFKFKTCVPRRKALCTLCSIIFCRSLSVIISWSTVSIVSSLVFFCASVSSHRKWVLFRNANWRLSTFTFMRWSSYFLARLTTLTHLCANDDIILCIRKHFRAVRSSVCAREIVKTEPTGVLTKSDIDFIAHFVALAHQTNRYQFIRTT